MDLRNILVAYDASGFSNRDFKSALDIAEPNEILATGYLDMNKVLEISIDSYIEKISGKANPVIRG